MQNLQVLHLLKAFLIHSSSQKEPAPYTHKQGTLFTFQFPSSKNFGQAAAAHEAFL